MEELTRVEREALLLALSHEEQRILNSAEDALVEGRYREADALTQALATVEGLHHKFMR